MEALGKDGVTNIIMKKGLKENDRGFTLVELIVVLVILSILTAMLVPSLAGYIDKAKGTNAIANARLAYIASTTGLVEWKAAGSPGNSDAVFKKKIESEIIKLLELGEMQSYTATNASENAVQVALSLPSAFSQGWERFIEDCTEQGFRNFVRVWVGKNLDKSIGNDIKAIYYIAGDGQYACRLVYDETTKLGSVANRTGVYYERIQPND